MIRAALIAGVTLFYCAAALAQDTGLRALETDYEARGWEAVGRIDLAGSGGQRAMCSGALIAPNLVLTAAHCLYDPSGRPRAPGDITFHAGYRNGSAVAQRQVVRYAAHRGYVPGPTPTADSVSHDIALLELASPIPTSDVNPFVLHSDVVEPGPVSVVSYGAGRSEYPSRQRSCAFAERYQNLLVFDCDVTFGSSGAPVFSHLNGRGRILSVISSGGQVGDRVRAFGPHLPDLVAELKQGLRRNASRPVPQVRRLRTGERSGTGAKFVRVD